MYVCMSVCTYKPDVTFHTHLSTRSIYPLVDIDEETATMLQESGGEEEVEGEGKGAKRRMIYLSLASLQSRGGEGMTAGI